MRTIASAVLILVLAGCGETAGPAGSQAINDSGWRIDPSGSLNTFFDCLKETDAGLISAHRGGAYPGLPENALETMAAVMSDTPAVMEIDVATSMDGVLYLMHDDTLDRTTTGSGPADGLPYDAIADLRLKDENGKTTAFAPPTFADVLAWADGRTILQIDFKRTTRYEDVIDEIKSQGAERRVVLIAYSMASAQKLHRLAPDAMISLSVNSQSELNRAVAAGVPADRLMGFTGTQSPRPRLFGVLDSGDVEVIFGTLGGASSIDNAIARSGDNAQYAELVAAGVDLIATDRPREAYAALVAADRAPEDGECGIARS